MSITGELRKYVQDWHETPNLMDDLDAGDVDGILADFEHIADRIDEKYEKAANRAGHLLADAESDRNCYYLNWQDCKQKVLQANITIDELNARTEDLDDKLSCLEDKLSHRIELPKDADGEYIHMGDVMESRAGFDLFPQFEVRAMRYDGDEWEVFDRLGDRYEPSGLRHYHAPTVEDVLREMLYKAHVYDEREMELLPDLIEEYAAKLRLAEEKEQ